MKKRSVQRPKSIETSVGMVVSLASTLTQSPQFNNNFLVTLIKLMSPYIFRSTKSHLSDDMFILSGFVLSCYIKIVNQIHNSRNTFGMQTRGILECGRFQGCIFLLIKILIKTSLQRAECSVFFSLSLNCLADLE